MLGRIELQQPVQGIPVASVVLSKSPLSWSEDNNLVLATQLGACIFELHFSPHGDQVGLIFDRVYLSTPEAPNPNILTGKRLRSVVSAMKPKDAHAVMMDADISASQRGKHELANRRAHAQGGGVGPGAEGNHLGYIKSTWSYRGATGGDRCFLCLVTFDHQVQLVYQVGVTWKVVYDVSSLWHEFSVCAAGGKEAVEEYVLSNASLGHHPFIAETKFHCVADVVWTPPVLRSGEVFSLLLVATVSSHLGLIRIPAFSRRCFEPSVLDCFSMDASRGRINALHWSPLQQAEGDGEGRVSGFLSVGTATGGLAIHLLSLSEGNSATLRTLIQFDDLLPGMGVNVVSLAAVDEGRNLYALFAALQNVLVVQLASLDPEGGGASLAVAHAFLGCLAISGIKVIDPSLVYTSINDGKIHEIEIEYDVEAPSVSFRNKRVVHSSESVLYKDFCFSPNNAFFAILECVSVPYDHLVLREPTMISLFQSNTFETILTHLKSDHAPQPLHEQVDIFESLRLLTYREETPPFPTLSTKAINSLSPYKKRVHLWIAFIQLKSLPPNDESKEEKEETISLLEESIIYDYIMEVFSSCSSKSFPKDPLHQHSLYSMFKFLQRTQKKHAYAKSIKKQLDKENVSREEKCLICRTPVEFNSVKTAQCSKGHNIPRCWRSLVPTIPVLRCTHCSLFYHPLAAQWYGEVATTCLLCSRKLSNRVSREVT